MSNFCQQGDITKIFIVDTGSTGSTGNDIYVTGGTYSNGTLTLGRNDGVSILISGFLTGVTDTYITGGTYSDGTLISITRTSFKDNVTSADLQYEQNLVIEDVFPS